MQKQSNNQDSIATLTSLFINLCGINAMKMHLVALNEDDKKTIVDGLVSQWETEARRLLDNQMLAFQEIIKQLPAKEKISAGLEMNKIQTNFENDLSIAKEMVVEILK